MLSNRCKDSFKGKNILGVRCTFNAPTFMLIVYAHPYCAHNLQATSCIIQRSDTIVSFKISEFSSCFTCMNEVGGPTFSVYFWNIQLFSGHSIHVSLTKIRISNLEAFCINIHNHLTYILVTCQVHVQCWSCWGPECCLWFSD